MKLLLVAALVFMLGFGATAEACQCVPNVPKDFFASLNAAFSSSFGASGTYIVEGKVLSPVGGYGTKVKVIDRFHGTNINDTIIVWGDPGVTCRVSLNQAYNIGDTVLMIMNHTADWTYPQETSQDYFVDQCGFYHLLIKNDSAFGGHVTSFTFSGVKTTTITDSLSKVLKTVSVPFVYEDCKIVTVLNSEQTKIHLKSDCYVREQISIIGLNGIIFNAILDNEKSIDITQLIPGLYTITVSGQNRKFSSRFLKQY